jgi:hypothetical protein
MWFKDLLVAARSPAEVLLSLAAPLVLLALASWIFTPTGRDLPIALLSDAPQSPVVSQIEDALTDRHGEPLYLRVVTRDRLEAERMLATGQIVAVVTVPDDIDARLAEGEALVDVVEWNGMGDLNKNTRLSLLRALERFHDQNSEVTLRAEVIDSRPVVLSRPGWFAGGVVIYALMFVGFLSGGIAVAREWENGTLPALRVVPVPGWRLALGKVATAATIAVASSVVVGAVGIGLTDLRLRGDIAALSTVLVTTAVMTSSVGLLLGLASRRYYLMMPLAGISAVVLWFLGGGFSDLTLARGTLLDAAAHALPTTYAFEALFAVVQGGGWPDVAADLTVVAATAGVTAIGASLAIHYALGPRLR